MNLSIISLIVFTYCIALSLQHGEHAVARPVPSFSFHAPFFPEAGSAAIPGWEVRGGTMVTSEFIRLTPDIVDRQGYITTTRPSYFRTFEITLHFRVHSNNPKMGADGLAFWLTEEPLRPGIAMGGQDVWNGVAVVMDSFDNNNNGDQPFIGIHHNDGTKRFSVGTDGSTTLLGGCSCAFRNAQLSYIHLFYEHGYLHLYQDKDARGYWTQCGGPWQVDLPERYYFGFSAATGGVSDNHDIYALSVNTMDPAGSVKPVEPKVQEPQANPTPVANTQENPTLATNTQQAPANTQGAQAELQKIQKEIEEAKLAAAQAKKEAEMEREKAARELKQLQQHQEEARNVERAVTQKALTEHLSSATQEQKQTLEQFSRVLNQFNVELKELRQQFPTLTSITNSVRADTVREVKDVQTSLEAKMRTLEARTTDINNLVRQTLNKANNIENNSNNRGNIDHQLRQINDYLYASNSEIKNAIADATATSFWIYITMFQFIFLFIILFALSCRSGRSSSSKLY